MSFDSLDQEKHIKTVSYLLSCIHCYGLTLDFGHNLKYFYIENYIFSSNNWTLANKGNTKTFLMPVLLMQCSLICWLNNYLQNAYCVSGTREAEKVWSFHYPFKHKADKSGIMWLNASYVTRIIRRNKTHWELKMGYTEMLREPWWGGHSLINCTDENFREEKSVPPDKRGSWLALLS